MKKKTIAITGVSKGLGNAMAREFARLGHNVVGCARSKSIVDDMQKEFGNEHTQSTAAACHQRNLVSYSIHVHLNALHPVRV